MRLVALLLGTWLVLPLSGIAAEPPVLDFRNTEHHRLAAEYSAARRGVSLLVIVNGEVVFEDYPNGSTVSQGYQLASGTKSFAGVLAAAAIADGLITSWDERLAETLTEWTDEARSQITLRQLLSLSSGLDPGRNLQVPTFQAAIEMKSLRAPDVQFAYGPAAFQIFGEFLTRKLKPTGQSYDDYLRARLLEPLGINVVRWMHGRDGQPHLPSGAVLTAREWSKFGEFVRLGGRIGEREHIPQTILDECFVSCPTNARYGLTFWLNREVSDEDQGLPAVMRRRLEPRAAAQFKTPVLPDLVMAAGAGDQRLYISRSQNLVVVRQANRILEAMRGQGGEPYRDNELLSLLAVGQMTLP